jgi:hypothetical protein
MLYAVAGLLGGMEGVFVTSDAMKADIEYSSDAVEWLEKADPDAREGAEETRAGSRLSRPLSPTALGARDVQTASGAVPGRNRLAT